MPLKKRNQNVSLTKTTKKDVEHKKQLIESVRKYCTTDYDHVFVLSVNNMRNVKLKALREQWKSSSRFVFGKNKLLQHALGRTSADECVDNVHKIVPYLTGQCGLLFTKLPIPKIESFFAQHDDYDFARTGDVASSTVELEAGPLTQFAHSMEPHLRTKLNLPVALKRGVVTLERDHTVCKAGEKLTSEQAQLLKLLDLPQAKFSIKLLCRWSKQSENNESTTSEFVAYEKPPDASKLKLVEGKRKRDMRKSKKRTAKPDAEDEEGDALMQEMQKERQKTSKKTIAKKSTKISTMKAEKNLKKEGKFKKSARMARNDDRSKSKRGGKAVVADADAMEE